MYIISIPNKKVRNQLEDYIKQRNSIKEKLDLLRGNLRRNCGAHPLKGNFKGKWACWLGSNIRAIYIINDLDEVIIIVDAGTHKIY